ncbi:MAG: helix-turn-helix transcriptional regulator [Phycisphaerales bacterium]
MARCVAKRTVRAAAGAPSYELDHLLYASRRVRIGSFRCPVWHPRFHESGPVGGHLVVFPRTSVVITQAGSEPVVADPNTAMLYNRAQEYRRDRLHAWGDRCEFFAFDPGVVVEAVRALEPRVDERADRPFRFGHAPADARVYLLQRAAVEHATHAPSPDALFLEETALEVLQAIVAAAHRARGVRPSRRRADTAKAHRDLAEGARSLLAERWNESLALEDIAEALHTSPYHLCRVFRRETGSTIHAYLDQLRVRASLERVADPGSDLTDVALRCGYSSHSHFTRAFGKAFGVTPSGFRREAASRSQTGTNVKAPR